LPMLHAVPAATRNRLPSPISTSPISNASGDHQQGEGEDCNTSHRDCRGEWIQRSGGG
jgi:hypothetical protein